MNHYVDLTLIAEPFALAESLTRTLTRVHGIIESTGVSLAVAFPEWTPDHPGKLIRLFGTEAALDLFVGNQGIQFLVKSQIIDMSAVTSVPSDVSEYRLYKRARQAERGTGKALTKRADRIKAHYLATEGKQMSPTAEANLLRRLRKSSAQKRPYIQISSLSTGQRFRLFIDALPMEAPVNAQTTFSAYGLGQSHADALPHF